MTSVAPVDAGLSVKVALESELKTHGKTIEEWVELSERTFNFARYAQIWFAKGDMQTRRAIFAALGSHLIIEDQKLNVELHPYFKIILLFLDKIILTLHHKPDQIC